jgi:hypothetical protein
MGMPRTMLPNRRLVILAWAMVVVTSSVCTQRAREVSSSIDDRPALSTDSAAYTAHPKERLWDSYIMISGLAEEGGSVSCPGR